MKVVIPFQGRIQTMIRSSFLVARRQTESNYLLKGEAFQMSNISATQVLIFPDEVELHEGDSLTDALLM